MNEMQAAETVIKIVVLLCFMSKLAAAAAASVSSQHVAQQPDRSTKSKVFVTDGRDVPLTGVCVFFTRANTSKTITSENIHRVSQRVTVEGIIFFVFLFFLHWPKRKKKKYKNGLNASYFKTCVLTHNSFPVAQRAFDLLGSCTAGFLRCHREISIWIVAVHHQC